ncbi:hypothetical protein CTI12_AA484600 [Artemisia annua]|uniref:Uncharacterized protein n=1 Tax=Artemisia annua TaxID=35608 RepID=A0A2U1LK60_ARTAN|nr:hypothetical protein CTI12_AA484600 [Artemisia annua]
MVLFDLNEPVFIGSITGDVIDEAGSADGFVVSGNSDIFTDLGSLEALNVLSTMPFLQLSPESKETTQTPTKETTTSSSSTKTVRTKSTARKTTSSPAQTPTPTPTNYSSNPAILVTPLNQRSPAKTTTPTTTPTSTPPPPKTVTGTTEVSPVIQPTVTGTTEVSPVIKATVEGTTDVSPVIQPRTTTIVVANMEEEEDEEPEASKKKKKGSEVEKKEKVAKRKGKKKLEDEDDIDDEEAVVEKNKAKGRGKKKVEEEEDEDEGNGKYFKSLRAKTTVKPFYNATHKLSPERKQRVREMGFGSLLDFPFNKIPTKLSYFVLKNLNVEKMEVNLPNGGVLKITPRKIREVLGIPMGQIPFYAEKKRLTKDSVYCKFMAQLSNNKRQRTTTALSERIQKSEGVDFIFELSYLTLFANCFGYCQNSAMLQDDVLENVKSSEDIPNIDWCTLIWDDIKGSKEKWDDRTLENWYYGPHVIFTLIYLHYTEFDEMDVPRKYPAIKYWNCELIEERQKKEMARDAIGMAMVIEEDEENEENENQKLKQTDEFGRLVDNKASTSRKDGDEIETDDNAEESGSDDKKGGDDGGEDSEQVNEGENWIEDRQNVDENVENLEDAEKDAAVKAQAEKEAEEKAVKESAVKEAAAKAQAEKETAKKAEKEAAEKEAAAKAQAEKDAKKEDSVKEIAKKDVEEKTVKEAASKEAATKAKEDKEAAAKEAVAKAQVDKEAAEQAAEEAKEAAKKKQRAEYVAKKQKETIKKQNEAAERIRKQEIEKLKAEQEKANKEAEKKRKAAAKELNEKRSREKAEKEAAKQAEIPEYESPSVQEKPFGTGKDNAEASMQNEIKQGKWIVKPSMYLQSPYNNKMSSVTEPLTEDETLLAHSLLSMEGDILKRCLFITCEIGLKWKKNIMDENNRHYADMIKTMRMRYAAKTLLHDVNKEREKMSEFAIKFGEQYNDQEKQKKMVEKAIERKASEDK